MRKPVDPLLLFVGIVVLIPSLLVAGFLSFMRDWTIGWYLLLVLTTPGVVEVASRLSSLYQSRSPHAGSDDPPFWRYAACMAVLTVVLFFSVYGALDYIIVS